MKRIAPYIFGAYFIICIVFTILNCNKQVENTQTDSYGLTTDLSIELREYSEIETRFQTTCDNLLGVSVKFQANNGFQDEKIRASLYNADTDELLAEDIAELKYELVRNKDDGANIFFELPVSDIKETDVKLVFTLEGEEIYVYPFFISGKTYDQESKLYVNGKKSKEKLVFSVRYDMGSKKYIIGSVVNGILWILVGGIVFLWILSICNKRKNDLEPGNKKKKKTRDFGKIAIKVKNIFSKNRIVLGLFLVVMFLGVVFLYVYKYDIEDALEKKETVTVFKERKKRKYYLTLDKNSEQIEQYFKCTRDMLNGLTISVLPDELEDDAELLFSIMDYTTGVELESTELNLKDCLSQNDKEALTIYLADTAVKANNHILGLKITPKNFKNTIIRISLNKQIDSDSYAIVDESDKIINLMEEVNKSNKSNVTVLLVDGKRTEGRLVLSIECGDVYFLKTMYVILCISLLLIVIILYYLCFVRKVQIATVFLLFTLTIGIIYSCVLGLYTIPDEPAHLDTAYQISNEILGIPESLKPGYIFKRADDVDMLAEAKETLNSATYMYLYKDLFAKVKDDSLVECAALNNLGNSSRVYYLPQALGICLGRILKLGSLATMMLGRLAALLCFTIMTFFAIKKLPFAKASMYLIAILPITLQQAASFSYDSVINGIAFLFVCYSLYIIYSEKDIKSIEIGVLCISGCLLAMAKGGVYFPICFLPLLALIKNREISKQQKKILIIIAAVFIFAFLKGNLINVIARLAKSQGNSVGGSSAKELYTIGYFVNNPKTLIGIFANTFYRQADSYLRNILGGSLSWINVNTNWVVSIGFLFIILLSCITYDKKENISFPEKLYMGLFALASFALVEVSMLLAWTPVDLKYITGVQGRYFLPFFLIVLVLIRNNFFEIAHEIDYHLIFCAGILNVITILQILQWVL